MTQQDQREYEWETGQRLLDESVTADDLIRHNSNIQHGAVRSRDEAIDRMVRGLYDKTNIKQDLTGVHAFALRMHARHIPPKLRNAAVESIMQKYEA
ncbi:MAG: hypothetical protein J6R99_02690 [Alphaproteobacteria bacterium]|nr:hypothetical protein [Alphaproteobacteria bacterium]MBO7066592.1 hypothetical protein [Alphaproteobacteria bacterium]